MADPLRVLIAHADTGVITRDKRAQTIFAEVNHGWRGSVKESIIAHVDPVNHDVVVLQRPLDKSMVDAIPHIQAQGVAVVVELDDDFWRIDKRNRANHKASDIPYSNADHLARACDMADLVTVSTPRLMEVVPARNGRVRLLRNYVPTSYLSIERAATSQWEMFDGRVIVGWSGALAVHPGDLETTGDGVKRAVLGTCAQFFAIGDKKASDILGFERGTTIYQPPIWFDNYPTVVAGLDIGIAPLGLTDFNEAKSYLKGLEYASLGVPFIASPTGEYKFLAGKGIGQLAKLPHEWSRALRRLIVDVDMRAELASTAKDIVRANFTYDSHAHQWLSAWRTALDFRRKAMT
jgi:hypothetical protein